MEDSNQKNEIKELADKIRKLNLELEEKLLAAKGEIHVLGTDCGHTGCICQGYSRGNGDGICGTCFHPAYEHL